MDEGSVFSKIFSAATGVWALVCMAAVALFKAWPLIMERINERRRDSATEKASDWQRIRDERDRLSEHLAACQADRAEWMTRAIQAEATLQGYGIARQQQAVEDAVKRLTKDEGKPDA